MTTNASLFITCALLFGAVFGMLLVAYEDGIPFGLIRKFNCKRGKHKHFVRIGRYKRALYRCQFCNEKRKHPKLTLIEGGAKKLTDIEFKF